jgi:hypothetical protein
MWRQLGSLCARVWSPASTIDSGQLGALAFVITFFTLIDGPGEDSVFGYGFFLAPCARDLVDRYEHCEIPRGGEGGRRSRRSGGRDHAPASRDCHSLRVFGVTRAA